MLVFSVHFFVSSFKTWFCFGNRHLWINVNPIEKCGVSKIVWAKIKKFHLGCLAKFIKGETIMYCVNFYFITIPEKEIYNYIVISFSNFKRFVIMLINWRNPLLTALMITMSADRWLFTFYRYFALPVDKFIFTFFTLIRVCYL